MKIRFKGTFSANDAVETLITALLLLEKRYEIAQFKDIEVDLTPLNSDSDEVELVDEETNNAFTVLEVRKNTLREDFASTEGDEDEHPLH